MGYYLGAVLETVSTYRLGTPLVRVLFSARFYPSGTVKNVTYSR